MNVLSSDLSGARRWYHFAYFVQIRGERRLDPHQTRDALAALCLEAKLRERGFEFVDQIFNYPAPGAPAEIPVDASFLGRGDLVVLTTRPPLDDDREGVRRRMDRSRTTLERKVFECIRRHLAYCSRSKVVVADRHARASHEVARLSNIQFRQNGGAAIEAYLPFGKNRWERPLRDSHVTVAYLIYEEQAWENGPAVLASFGMCGSDTLAWNYALSTSFPNLIAAVPFAMAEIHRSPRSNRPHTLTEFLGGLKVRLITPANV